MPNSSCISAAASSPRSTRRSSRSDVTILDLADAVAAWRGADPHFWLDPTRMADAPTAVESALAEVARATPSRSPPTPTSTGASSRPSTRSSPAGLAACARSEIVTAHAAFHYLAERYGLDEIAIAGVTPESEPDPERLADLAEFVDDHGVTTVFYESLVAPDLAETLAREAGVETAVLDPIEGLSDDAVDDGASYVQRDGGRTWPPCGRHSDVARTGRRHRGGRRRVLVSGPPGPRRGQLPSWRRASSPRSPVRTARARPRSCGVAARARRPQPAGRCACSARRRRISTIGGGSATSPSGWCCPRRCRRPWSRW